MDGIGFFQATVPVFLHYTTRLDAMLSRLNDGQSAELAPALASRLAPDTFSAGEHFRTAQGFAPRTVFALIGRPVPGLSTDHPDAAGLHQRFRDLHDLLSKLTPDDFEQTAKRTITHTAGKAVLSQDATDFLTLFALPNFFFHLTMGFATLRHRGIEIGKADFDGQHVYPKGFRFSP